MCVVSHLQCYDAEQRKLLKMCITVCNRSPMSRMLSILVWSCSTFDPNPHLITALKSSAVFIFISPCDWLQFSERNKCCCPPSAAPAYWLSVIKRVVTSYQLSRLLNEHFRCTSWCHFSQTNTRIQRWQPILVCATPPAILLWHI